MSIYWHVVLIRKNLNPSSNDMKGTFASASVNLRIIQNALTHPLRINVGGMKFIALKRLRQLPVNN